MFSKKEAKLANERMNGTRSPEKAKSSSRKMRSPSRIRDGPMGLPTDVRLRRVLKNHVKKRQKAIQRQRKYSQKMRASLGEKSLLEAASIKMGQRQDYARRLEKFYSFVIRFQLAINTVDQLDVALCEFADHEYLNGEGAHCGEKLQAALEYERPEYSRHGSLNLPRFKRAMKGWRRLSPTQTRLPMPEFLKASISAVLIHRGWTEEALFNEVSFSKYARPGELLRVQAMDVVSPNKDFEHAVIVLGPMERGESSKAGIYDEVLILDDVKAPWLPNLLQALAQKKMKQEGEEAMLWSFSAAQYLQRWRAAVSSLQAEDIAISPYQNRHGGVSRDHLKRLRSVASIQRRGRWASDSSARIYDKPGRMQQVINVFGGQLQDLGDELQRNFNIYYLNGASQLPRRLRLKLQRICSK